MERRIPVQAPDGTTEIGLLLRESDSLDGQWSIGSTALTLAAVLRCRPRHDTMHDACAGGLARTVLGQQRDDGGFHHRLDGRTGRPAEQTGGRLYVDGQAVLGLVLLERVARTNPVDFPPYETVRSAVERAMEFYGERYWDHFAGQFFFIEENWHCIAASAALTHHRHDAYERLCLDYLAFKARFVHDGTTGAADDFRGGWGFSNLVPPHNTATAGFGEAMAAGLMVMKAREMETAPHEALMERAMAFLIRNQWQAATCFACSPEVQVAGGFSEHMASAPIRIDFVQHAWAALGHGARALDHEWSRTLPIAVHFGDATPEGGP